MPGAGWAVPANRAGTIWHNPSSIPARVPEAFALFEPGRQLIIAPGESVEVAQPLRILAIQNAIGEASSDAFGGLGDVVSTALGLVNAASHGFAGAALAAPLVGAFEPVVAEYVAAAVEVEPVVIAEEVGVFESISNWFGNALEQVGNWFSADEVVDLGMDLGGLGEYAPEVFSEALPDLGQDLGNLGIGDLDAGGLGEWVRLADFTGQIFSDTPGGGNITPTPGVQQTMGIGTRTLAGIAGIGGTVAAGVGAMTLAGIFGAARAGGSFVINGIKGTIPQLWKYTRKYGPQAVASGLGISVGALGTILLQNPDRPRRRGRGISARDVRTTKRVVRFVKRVSRDVGFRHHHHGKH